MKVPPAYAQGYEPYDSHGEIKELEEDTEQVREAMREVAYSWVIRNVRKVK